MSASVRGIRENDGAQSVIAKRKGGFRCNQKNPPESATDLWLAMTNVTVFCICGTLHKLFYACAIADDAVSL